MQDSAIQTREIITFLYTIHCQMHPSLQYGRNILSLHTASEILTTHHILRLLVNIEGVSLVQSSLINGVGDCQVDKFAANTKKSVQ